MGDGKREDAPDLESSAPESGQPAGGREQPGEPLTSPREASSSRPGDAGEDRENERWRAADGSDQQPSAASERRTLSEEKEDD